MNNIEHDYLKLLHDIMVNGVTKSDRTGTGTKSVFGRQIRHDMKIGFPLLTTKKMAWKSIVTELIWFLRGDTNIKYLLDNGCNIWTGDAFGNYLRTYKGNFVMDEEEFVNAIKNAPEFAERYGDLGPIYGKQWRAWSFPEVNSYFGPIDQIKILVQSLKTNPDSRRLMVNAWNVGELHEMTLPPCHYGFQVYTRELSLEERYVMYFEKLDHTMVPLDIKIPNIHQYFTELNIPTRAISLMWNQRSVDTPLGLPFNIASYALLLELLAMETNMIPDQLIGNLGDCHIYLNQTDGVKEQLTRSPLPLGKLVINDEFWNPDVRIFEQQDMRPEDFRVDKYESHPTIKFPLSN